MAGSSLLGGHEKKHKVTIVGSGNWYVATLLTLAVLTQSDVSSTVF